jgi:hypothetical protein
MGFVLNFCGKSDDKPRYFNFTYCVRIPCVAARFPTVDSSALAVNNFSPMNQHEIIDEIVSIFGVRAKNRLRLISHPGTRLTDASFGTPHLCARLFRGAIRLRDRKSLLKCWALLFFPKDYLIFQSLFLRDTREIN